MRTTAMPQPQPWVAAARAERRESFRRRMAAADLLVAIAWTSVALACGLLLASGGAATISLHDVGSLFTAAGIVTGLAATDLLLVMLVLAARVPLIDRTFGHDRALAAHRRIGKPALYLLLAHAVLLTIGYGISDRTGPIAETVTLLTSGRDMLLAYLGLALLIGVVITSLTAVRRRFAYEAWHLLHLISYLGIAIALPARARAGRRARPRQPRAALLDRPLRRRVRGDGGLPLHPSRRRQPPAPVPGRRRRAGGRGRRLHPPRRSRRSTGSARRAASSRSGASGAATPGSTPTPCRSRPPPRAAPCA